MFIITMASSFEVGRTLPCKISGRAERRTYRDAETLIIEANGDKPAVGKAISNDYHARDFRDADQVADAMQIAAAFFHVPQLYVPAVGAVATDMVACIAERMGAQSGVEVAP